MTFASNIFQPLIDFFEAILQFFHDNVGLAWGWAIIALTLLVRACLLPLTLKQFKSMQSLAAHQPELKKLQERYKHDKDRLNQEMMKFYRENKINPLASCLPMVAQLPVFISLFYMLRVDLRYDICPDINPPETLHPVHCTVHGPYPDAEFFFIPDLTHQASGAVLVALLILYVGSQMLSTALSSVSADRNQRMIMFFLPLFFVAFVWRFPAGLLLYWITTNCWTIVQQTIVRRRLGPMKPSTNPDLPEATGWRAVLGLPSPEQAAHDREERARAKEESARQKAAKADGAGSTNGKPKARPTGPPPPPPRTKKKRSGRRR
jgi:YidC/Oxa1 family membrane protein insertase